MNVRADTSGKAELWPRARADSRFVMTGPTPVRQFKTSPEAASFMEIGSNGWRAIEIHVIKLLHEIRHQPTAQSMGETLQPVKNGFNKSLCVESRAERWTLQSIALIKIA